MLRIGLVCRTFLIFLRLQRSESNASFKYLDHDRVTSRKCFRSVWKNAALWKIFSKSSSVASLTWFGATWFQKSTRKSLFLQYKMFGWSYGHDSKCATFLWSERIFYMLRTYAYDQWKFFYGLLKSKSLPKSHSLRQQATKNDRIFYHFVWLFGEDFDFKSPWKTFDVSHGYFLSM